MRFLIACLFFVSPALACEAPFRAGLAAFAEADATLSATEESLYRGLGWASRGAVVERLEARSARTTACDEVGALQRDLARARRWVSEAETRFRLAQALCVGENRVRAARNLEALGDTADAIARQAAYLASLTERCVGG